MQLIGLTADWSESPHTMPNVREGIRTAILSTPIWLLLRFWTLWVVARRGR